jgi:threonine/homoserine/homoserine lactone efflux protein
MNLAGLFLTSTGFGLAVAAPVGPMALICMRRTIALGWPHGFATGAGIAVGDGIYAGVAAFGLAGISGFLIAQDRLLHAAAGAFLVYLAVKPFLGRMAAEIPEATSRPDQTVTTAAHPLIRSLPAAFASAVLLTLANPPTIILFAAIFAALAPKAGLDADAAATTVAGVVAGSLLWWCGLIAIVTLFRQVLAARSRRLIDIIVAVVLILFGAIELAKAMSATVAVASISIPCCSLALPS